MLKISIGVNAARTLVFGEDAAGEGAFWSNGRAFPQDAVVQLCRGADFCSRAHASGPGEPGGGVNLGCGMHPAGRGIGSAQEVHTMDHDVIRAAIQALEIREAVR